MTQPTFASRSPAVAAPALPDVAFRPGRRVCAGIEWLDFSGVPRRRGLAVPPESPHRIRFNALMLVTGPCRHHVDFEAVELAAGDALFVRSGAAFSYSAEQPAQAVGLVFSDDAAESLASLLAVDPRFALRTRAQRCFRRTLPPERLDEALGAAELLKAHLSGSPDPHAVRLLASFALTLALSGHDAPEAPTGRPGDRDHPLQAQEQHRRDAERFRRFVQRVEADPANARSVSKHADALGMSPGRLNLLVKRVAGVTAKRWVDESLLLEAKRRLATEDHSIESISLDLGFSEATHFVKFFARMSGMTPGAFRRSQRPQMTHEV